MVLVLVVITLLTRTLNAYEIAPNTLKFLNSFTRNCEIVYIGEKGGYGLKATKDIHYGDTIMVIPPIFMLSSFDIYPWSGKLESYTHDFRLVIRLLYEKFVIQDNSNRKLVIDSLPKTFSTVFSVTEEQKLKFRDYFGNSNIGLPVNCTSDYELFIKIQDKEIKKCKECFKQNNFLWACQISLTRAYLFKKSDFMILSQNKVIRASENVRGSALIFGVDMFNHYPRPELKNKSGGHGIKYIGEPAQINVVADRTFLAGDEVFMSYGSKSNYELYLIHGFIIENNTDDFGIIGVPSDGSDCESFSQIYKFCEFFIRAKKLSAEIANYLFFRLTGTKTLIKDVYEIFEKTDETIFKAKNLVAVFTKYKSILKSYSLNKCKGEIKTGKNIENLDTLDRLCQESHKLFISHTLRLDHLLVSLFFKELI